MKKINKIILFYPNFDKGGATKILINLVNFFLKKNIKIDLISLNAKYEYFIKKKTFQIFNISKKKRNYLFSSRILYALASILLLIKQLRKNKNKNTIVFSMQSHLVSTIICKLYNTKIIIRNSEDPFSATKYADNKFFAIITFVSKYISFNLADKIITNSSESLKSINFFLINKNKVRLIFNPYISSNKSKKRPINYKRNNQILAIGRFSKQKNFEFLIDTFSLISTKLKNYKLIIVGSGSGKNILVNKIKSLNMSNKIILKKWTNDLNKVFRKSKIFVLPSLYEGSPNILIDAVKYGIPCISSNCSGAKDILKKNKGGLIYPINDQKVLVKHIFHILNKYKFYEKASYKFVNTKKRFFIISQAEKYLNFFNSK